MNISNQHRNHNYSRPLDVHLTCNHREINELVEVIFNKYFDNLATKSIKPYKYHLKIVLLDLYVAWLHDPLLEIAVHLSPNHYSKKIDSRESKLYITKTIIPVIKTLRDKGLIGFQTGFHNHSEYGNRLSRIWASPILEDYFKEIQSLAFFDFYKEREVILLRDEDKNNIAYKRNSHVDDMKTVVDNYNSFLRETFIDIPYLDKPTLKYKNSEGRERRIYINQQTKFTSRIFNNSSFKVGGRFYGGWWQSISEEYRKDIYLDNRPSREIDFTALHPILAYAEKGINYWETKPVGSNSLTDPYDIPTFGLTDKKLKRKFVKLFFLTSLNADTETKAIKGFIRDWGKTGLKLPETYSGLLQHSALKELLEQIKEYHYPIRDLICSGRKKTHERR